MVSAHPPTVVDLTAPIAEHGVGVHWTLEPPSQLNVNLVRLEPGDGIDGHRNDEVDVAVIVVSGEGQLVVDGGTHALRANTVAHVPRGANRGLTAEPNGPGLSYFTVHTRRSGPTITARRSAGPPAAIRRRPRGVSDASHPPVRAALLMIGAVLLVVVLATLSTFGT